MNEQSSTSPFGVAGPGKECPNCKSAICECSTTERPSLDELRAMRCQLIRTYEQLTVEHQRALETIDAIISNEETHGK